MNPTINDTLPTSLALGADEEESSVESKPSSLGQRLRAAWKRRRYQQIQRAIRTYNAEKHFLSPVFRPIAGPATMRMAQGEIERNKLPLNAETTGPWASTMKRNLGPLMLPGNSVPESSTAEPLVASSELPASLRQQRPSQPEPAQQREDDESPIILVT